MSALIGRAPPPDFVPPSAELFRISNLRRRVMAPEDMEWLADELTARLKKPRGTMRLKPVQAWALYELGTVGGLFGSITVGAGKTLISLLAPVIMKSHRPLLIVPAGLVEKTKRDKEVLEQHWYLPLFIRIMSYEWLGRLKAGGDPENDVPGALDEWDPDLVFLDECHRAKNNKDAAVARRINRFFRDKHKKKRKVVVVGHYQQPPKPVHCGAVSGTATKRSILDFAHILTWCLPAELVPVPTHWNDLKLWSDALDEKKGDFARVDPGALEILCADAEDRKLWLGDRKAAARQTFRRRLVETPGVVATHETGVDATIVVRALGYEPGPNVDAAFNHLRENWETPDGWTIPDPMTFARHARELALGFFYVWSPRPPPEWEMPRKIWHAFVRDVLKHSRKWDSEKQVRIAHADSKECREWLAVRDTFTPNTVPVWIDSTACEFAAEWARKNVGIIWTEHKCVGQRLRDEFGLTYYGAKGFDVHKRFIDNHDTRTTLVASRAANSEGRNLQGWNKNLIMSLLPNGARNQQLIGRTHRPGQFADEVTFEFLVSCREQLEALDQAMRDARYIEHATGAPQKLLLATVDVDDRSLRGFGPRWAANKSSRGV